MTDHLAAVRIELAELRDHTAARGGTTRAGLILATRIVEAHTETDEVEEPDDHVDNFGDDENAPREETIPYPSTDEMVEVLRQAQDGPIYLDEIVQRDRDVIDRIVTILADLQWRWGTVAQIAAVLIDAGYATTVDGRFVRIEP